MWWAIPWLRYTNVLLYPLTRFGIRCSKLYCDSCSNTYSKGSARLSIAIALTSGVLDLEWWMKVFWIGKRHILMLLMSNVCIKRNCQEMQKECPGWGSNSRPSDCSCLCDYETDALPTALPRHMIGGGKVNLSNSVTLQTTELCRAVQSFLGPMQDVCLKAFHLTYFWLTHFMSNFRPCNRSLRGLMDKASAS